MPEPMPKITNPVLVDAMATFKLDLTNAEHERTFLQAALEAKYLIPVKAEKVETEAPPAEGERVPVRIVFQMMTNQQGDKFMPAFTDEVELRKNRNPNEVFQIAVMNFQDIYRFIKSQEGVKGAVINPFGSNLCLIRQQIIALGDVGGDLDKLQELRRQALEARQAQGQPPIQMHTNQQAAPSVSAEKQRDAQQAAIRQAMADLEAAKAAAQEGTAAEEENPITDELIDALKATLKKQKAVKKAYIKADAENDERFLLIALDAEGADIEEIAAALTSDCADYASLPFDCVPASNIRAKELVNSEKPFYEKKRFGIF